MGKNDDEDQPGGSGDGGTFGTPTGYPKAEPPSVDQETNEVVSGGGVANPSADDGEPSEAAKE